MKNNMVKMAVKGRELYEDASFWVIRKYFQAKDFLNREDPGVDGILVTVGLCIIALVLCVVMKDSLTAFIQTLVQKMTTEAESILSSASTPAG